MALQIEIDGVLKNMCENCIVGELFYNDSFHIYRPSGEYKHTCDICEKSEFLIPLSYRTLEYQKMLMNQLQYKPKKSIWMKIRNLFIDKEKL